MTEVGARVRSASRTTPGRYRLWSLAAAIVLVVATVAATASASRMRSSTRRAEANSGPVLVATQQLVSSLAEADAAATAAFLSGKDEDPEQRRLYEQALARANQQVEEIAALAGGDKAVRATLSRISVQITRYAGLVEAARASNRNGTTDANGYLVSAVQAAGQLVDNDVQTLTAGTQATLTHDIDRRSQGFLVATAALVVGLALLGLGQFRMLQASRRILNPPLVLASLLTLASLVWLVLANTSSGSDMDAARTDGYDSIVLTAKLGSAGFGAKASETLALITGDSNQRRNADTDASTVSTATISSQTADQIRAGRAGGAPGGVLGQAAAAADSARERAAVAEVALRWARYQATVQLLRSAGTTTAARTIAVGPASSDFNGFNFSVQSVLGQNRDQFLSGLASAADRTRRLPTVVPLLLLGAIGVTFLGFQLRINDYR